MGEYDISTFLEGFVADDNAMDFDGPAGYTLFGDALFRKHKKSGWQIVESPNPALEGRIADTHAHLGMLANAPLSLARSAVSGIDFICTIADPAEAGEGLETYAEVDAWRSEALRMLPDVFEATRRAMAEHRVAMAQTGNALPEEMTSDEWRANRCPCEAVPVPRVRIAAGVHPHNASKWDDAMEARLYAMLADGRTSVLGEVGLDYHYDLSPREVQRSVFRRQIRMAHECGLPLMLHMRDAHDDGFAILEEEGWPAAGVLLHCCSVGPDELARWIDRGCFVAFGGAVTFAKSDEIRASAIATPQDRLLFETDAPYMAPVPFRGIECAPEFTVFTAERIAAERGIAPGEGRAALLAAVHETSLALLDREPTAWQVAHGR